jgi:hypothetical protein
MRPDAGATSLELDQDTRAQRLEWQFERAGWGAIGLLLAGGLAGLFGDGPLAGAEAVTDDGRATLRYDRIVHRGTPSELELTLAPASGGDTLLRISVDRTFLDAVEVQHIVPEPVLTAASSERVEYQFRRLDHGQPAKVVFSIAPVAVGARHGSIGTTSGPLAIEQVVLP